MNACANDPLQSACFEGCVPSAIENPSSKRARVITWNVWGMPFVSPRVLTRPLQCADELGRRLAVRTDLDVLCVQEAWGWRAGPFWFIFKISQWLEHLVWPFSLLSYVIFVLGLVGVLLPLPPMWDPKASMAHRIAEQSGHELGKTLFVIGSCDISWETGRAIMDSGLMMLVTRRPTATGFSHFDDRSREDALSNKGFLWIYYGDINALVVTTHLQASGEGVRNRQLGQLRNFVFEFQCQHPGCKVLLAGDFNIPSHSMADVENVLNLPLLSCAPSIESLDHVMGDFFAKSRVKTFCDPVVELSGLSDHPVVEVVGEMS